MKYLIPAALAVFTTSVSAFPNLPPEVYRNLPTRSSDGGLADVIEQRSQGPSLKAARKFSRDEGNCGLHDCDKFDATKQYVSTTGAHAYASPLADQIRGPCPGLNAASNHGYLPRDGVANIPQTITGLGEMYSMAVDLGGVLAAYAIALDGDIIGRTWSIGGPQPTSSLAKSLGYNPQGISWSHNKYEGDTSIGRQDAYINGGNAHNLSVEHFKVSYGIGQDDGTNRYTLDKFRRVVGKHQAYSIQNNPYYFAPLFSTTLVAPAAYNFVINFMSNHSEAEPAGYLDGHTFSSFFAVTGKYDKNRKDGGLTWLPGQERIPDNWYKRPGNKRYQALDVIKDLAVGWAAYPDTFRFGGNTGKTDSYVGVDIGKLTGGTFNAKTLFEGNNFACLLFMTQQQAVPDQLKGVVNHIAAATKLIDEFSKPIYSKLACPQLAKYDNSVFDSYPGRNYNPSGAATNY